MFISFDLLVLVVLVSHCDLGTKEFRYTVLQYSTLVEMHQMNVVQTHRGRLQK